jgi:hypothetical protein
MEFINWSRAALHNVTSGGFDTPAVANSGIIPQSRPKALFSVYFAVHNSLILLVFDATLLELMRASLNHK